MDLKKLHKIVPPIMQEAEQIALQYYRNKATEISLKKDKSLVTEADIKINQLFVKKLKEEFPETGFITEEQGKENEKAEYVWCIDPIDGTSNFANGFPMWAISLALLKDRKPLYSFVSLPILNERFWTDQESSYLNGKTLSTSSTKKDVNTRNIIVFDGIVKSKNFSDFVDIIKKHDDTPRIFGSTVFSCLTLLKHQGELVITPSASIWDIAAVWGLIEKSGFSIFVNEFIDPNTQQNRFSLIAGNKDICDLYTDDISTILP